MRLHFKSPARNSYTESLPTSLNILFTCRQIRHEASPVAYDLIKLDVTTASFIYPKFLPQIVGSRLFRSITTVEVEWYQVEETDAQIVYGIVEPEMQVVQLARDLPALKRVYVKYHHTGYYSFKVATRVVREFFERPDLEINFV